MNTINIPVLALRGMTAFPGETVSFDVEREISIFALDNAMEGDSPVSCVFSASKVKICCHFA